MDPIGEKILEVAKAELGYREESGGYTKYGDWYGKNVDKSPYFATAAWCDMFLAWAAHKAGVAEWAGQFAYTPFHAAWFKQQGAWGADPQPGAIVFFDWGGSKSLDAIDHVGIVEKVEGNRIHTIEGNADGVHLKRKVRTPDTIVGYGYPSKVKVKGKSVESVTSSGAPPEKYVPKHAAPAPKVDSLGGGATAVAATQGVAPRERENPPQEQHLPGLTDLLTIALAGSVALAVGKSAVVKLPELRIPGSLRLEGLRLPTSSPIRVRKRGRHHRTPVALPADVTPADLAAADRETVAMPLVSAAVAAEAEDREFWSQISRLEEEGDLEFWSAIADAVAEAEVKVPASGERA